MPTPSIDNLTNVSGIGPAAIEKFRDAGYETLADVADATLNEITAVPGIGEATAKTILEYVAEELDAVEDDQDEPAAEIDDEVEEQATAEDTPSDEDEEVAGTAEASAAEQEQAPASENGEIETSPAQSHEEIIQHLSEALSPEHLRLLRVFHNPQTWAHEHEQEYPQTKFLELSTVLEHAIPEWRNDEAQYDQLWRDLYNQGLVTTESLNVMTSRAGALSGRTSDLGHAVLSYADNH